MTHSVKSYDCADFAAVVATSAPDTSDETLKGMLVASTDIPADRIDACFAELKASDMFDALRGMAMIIRIAKNGQAPTTAELRQCFASCVWNDDGINTAIIRTTIPSEDGKDEATIEIKRNY